MNGHLIRRKTLFHSHECLGRYVGMVMIPEMVRQVMLRKDVEPKGNIDYKSGPFPESYDYTIRLLFFAAVKLIDVRK